GLDDEEDLSAEELLISLEGSSLAPPATPSLPEPTRMPLELEDHTEVSDTLAAIRSSVPPDGNPFPNEEELGSSAFEIAREAEPDQPPPPPPPGGTGEEKRPSFLGRLFGKKD